MNTTSTATTRPVATDRAAPWFALTAVASLGLALYHVLTPGAPTASYGSFNDWLRELTFLLFLLTHLVSLAVAHRVGLAPTATRWLVSGGYGLILVGVSVGLALQDDPDWFFLLAGPGLLLSAAGWLVWAVWGLRRGRLPVYAAALCGVGGLVAIIGSEFGTTVLLAAFWGWLAVSCGPRQRRASHTMSRSA